MSLSMRLSLRLWIIKNLLILASLVGALYIYFHIPNFPGSGYNILQVFIVESYIVPFVGFLIILGGTGIFAWKGLKQYRLISSLFILPFTISITIYLLQHSLIHFLYFFFLALLAQTLDLFVILSTTKKPGKNLLLTIIFFAISIGATQLFMDFAISILHKNMPSNPYETSHNSNLDLSATAKKTKFVARASITNYRPDGIPEVSIVVDSPDGKPSTYIDKILIENEPYPPSLYWDESGTVLMVSLRPKIYLYSVKMGKSTPAHSDVIVEKMSPEQIPADLLAILQSQD